MRATTLTSIAVMAVFGCASLSWAQSSPAPVKLYTKAQVEAGFENKVLILDPGHNEHYMVETSRRDAPGGAEVHVKATDVMMVMKGSATIVYGGTVADVEAHPPVRPGNMHPEDEIRGARIIGGETRHLAVGDVMVIPNGVPHQFTEVQAPFWYYVVKSK
jgi:glc operon protein GlcG